jgi:hypothetical protein
MIQVRVPGSATTGTMVLGQGPDAEEYEVKLGGLDPLSEKSGAATRLRNLGFYRGTDTEAGLKSAICSFQQSKQLKVTGTLDNQNAAGFAAGVRVLEMFVANIHPRAGSTRRPAL